MEANAKSKFQNTDDYIAAFPARTQRVLKQLRKTIKKAAPHAEEFISYNMPAFKQNGILAYFAAYKNHIGFYATSAPIEAFKDELTNYKTSKGAIQFRIEDGIPAALVTRIIQFKLAANQKKAEQK
jgi:uncharacterized protein YdhG (YjbR/CyaY superfamily)